MKDMGNHEEHSHFPSAEQERLRMEAEHGPLFVKYKKMLGRSVRFKSHTGSILTGRVLWIAKTYFIETTGEKPRRRRYFPLYVVNVAGSREPFILYPNDLIVTPEKE